MTNMIILINSIVINFQNKMRGCPIDTACTDGRTLDIRGRPVTFRELPRRLREPNRGQLKKILFTLILIIVN